VPFLHVAVKPYAPAVQDSEIPWTWRQRVRDPRFPALLCLVLAGALLASAVFGFDTVGLVLVVFVGGLIAVFALPRWRDPSHGPRAGATVLMAAALLVGLGAWFLK
jgi:hypothetical protein